MVRPLVAEPPAAGGSAGSFAEKASWATGCWGITRSLVAALCRHPPEALTMATIPARTVSRRRCQTAASSVTMGKAGAPYEYAVHDLWAVMNRLQK
jgi:hypothetical protein